MFRSHPDPSEWDNYVDFESTSWPKKDRRRYWIVPSICFNCESACGIIAYVDQQTLDVRKIEGNPLHPGSRGRTCAKGVVTPNQLTDPDRILHPLKRTGKRGGVRIIYYWAATQDRILMLLVYAKNERDDLSPDQLRVLRRVVETEFP